MNKCLQCNANYPVYTRRSGKTICSDCKGVNTILNTDQAYSILYQALNEGFLVINSTEVDPETKLVYANYSLVAPNSELDDLDLLHEFVSSEDDD